jgi:hypothetical protein
VRAALAMVVFYSIQTSSARKLRVVALLVSHCIIHRTSTLSLFILGHRLEPVEAGLTSCRQSLLKAHALLVLLPGERHNKPLRI